MLGVILSTPSNHNISRSLAKLIVEGHWAKWVGQNATRADVYSSESYMSEVIPELVPLPVGDAGNNAEGTSNPQNPPCDFLRHLSIMPQAGR